MDKVLQKAVETIVRVADPDRIILFGSRMREEHTSDSDYDLLVIKKGVSKPRELSGRIYQSFRGLGAPVDVIVADADTFEERKSNEYMVYHDAAINGRIVYEKQG